MKACFVLLIMNESGAVVVQHVLYLKNKNVCHTHTQWRRRLFLSP